MARYNSVYNDIGIATDGVVDIINMWISNSLPDVYVKHLDPYIKGGLDKWKADMQQYREDYDTVSGPLKTGYNEMSSLGILKNRPELYVRLALAAMQNAREEGMFEALSDEEFDSLIGEFESDPSNFTPAKRRAISIKYDKELQQDMASKRELEEWTKRQWQLKAGIIK